MNQTLSIPHQQEFAPSPGKSSRIRRAAKTCRWMLFVLGVSLLFAASPDAEATVRLVDQNLSVATAREGDIIKFRYRIESDQNRPAWLGAVLISPNGQVLEDPYQETANRSRVDLRAGTHWYERNFLINLAPSGSGGNYDAQWEIDLETSEGPTARRNGLLNVRAPVAVRVPILMYHKVGDTAHSQYWVTSAQFESHVRALLANGYTIVSLSDVADYRAGRKQPPAKPVVITFDDGYEDLLTHVLPVISKSDLRVPVTAFVNPGRFGQTNVWDENIDFNQEPVVNHLTWSQARQLHNSGLVDIQSHTNTHVNLLAVDQQTRLRELTESREALENGLDKRILFFAYPWGGGADHPQVQADVHKAGYLIATGTNNVPQSDTRAKYALHRHDIHSGVTAELNPSQPQNYLFGGSLLNDSGQGAGDFHPADQNQNLVIDSTELSAYASAWLKSEHTQADYLTRAAEIWLRGGSYTINPNANGSNKWVIAP